MANIEWDNSLAVGVELIDDQHKQLLEKLNDISKAIEADRGVEKIGNTLDFMLEYTDFHFSTEEKLMEELDYPDMKSHKALHREFVTTLKDMIKDFLEDGPTRELATATNTLLLNWLIKHIKEIDHRFGEFLNEKGFAG